MIFLQGRAQSVQSDQGNDILIAFKEWLKDLDARGSGACHPNGFGPLDKHDDKELANLKVRIHLHADKEFHHPLGLTTVEPPIDLNPHPTIGIANDRPFVGGRLFRTVAFGVITAVMVGAAFAWQSHGDDETKDTVRGWGTSPRGLSPVVSSNFWPSSSDVAAELASKTSDRIPTQDTALLQAAPVTMAPVPVAPGSPPELQHQLETMVSDIAVVRRIVERLAAIQEQMALDFATLQKSDQNVRQKVSLPPHSPAAVPPRKYAPSIARSDVVAHSPSVPVPTAPARTLLAPQ